MIRRMVLGLYRALRRVLLPDLSAADVAEMDELIARRVRDAATRPGGVPARATPMAQATSSMT